MKTAEVFDCKEQSIESVKSELETSQITETPQPRRRQKKNMINVKI